MLKWLALIEAWAGLSLQLCYKALPIQTAYNAFSVPSFSVGKTHGVVFSGDPVNGNELSPRLHAKCSFHTRYRW